MNIRDTKESLLVTNADLSRSQFADVSLHEARFTDVNLSKTRFADSCGPTKSGPIPDAKAT